MLFNSFRYIWFLPIVVILYWLVPHRYRNVLLLVASYYFYMSWNAKYLIIIILSTLLSYTIAILISKDVNSRNRKAILSVAICISLIILVVFKYAGFLIDNFQFICDTFAIPVNVQLARLVVPVGISFYTFQTISYMVDVYKGEITPEKNLITYATFVSFFPQLVAGPIERTRNLLPQLIERHSFDSDKAISGAKLMLWGYYKKLVIADNISIYVDNVYGNLDAYTNLDVILAVFFFSIQIYCDFSGYSDIAIGTAKLLDINLMTNFKSPYLSSSIKEFWSRWHISLSSWFRDYVYIPLGGGHCSHKKKMVNILVTFLLSGLWHGANWTYVIWGGLHGCGRIVEECFPTLLNEEEKSRIGKIIQCGFCFAFCNFAWIFFRADSIHEAFGVIRRVWIALLNVKTLNNSSMISPLELLCLLFYIFILLVYDVFDCKLIDVEIFRKQTVRWCFWVFVGILFVLCSQKGIPAEFVYFQF